MLVEAELFDDALPADSAELFRFLLIVQEVGYFGRKKSNVIRVDDVTCFPIYDGFRQATEFRADDRLAASHRLESHGRESVETKRWDYHNISGSSGSFHRISVQPAGEDDFAVDIQAFGVFLHAESRSAGVGTGD